MSKIAPSQVLLERLISTNGFAVRSHIDDDAYWYTSGKPGPFYINTENIVGEQEATEMLSRINRMLGANLSMEKQSREILEMINQVVEEDPLYRASIDALLDYYLSHSTYKPTIISGGERRDWFFSIPVAKKLKIPHIFLYKSGDYQVTDHHGNVIELSLQDQKVLHVADIINQASSYVNRWIPILKRAGVTFTETLSVAVRSQQGVDHLKQHHISVISPLIVDRSLFAEAYTLGLINKFAYGEIEMFYDSPEEWTRSLLSNQSEADQGSLHPDPTKKERMERFKNTDPYHLKSEFPLFFS